MSEIHTGSCTGDWELLFWLQVDIFVRFLLGSIGDLCLDDARLELQMKIKKILFHSNWRFDWKVPTYGLMATILVALLVTEIAVLVIDHDSIYVMACECCDGHVFLVNDPDDMNVRHFGFHIVFAAIYYNFGNASPLMSHFDDDYMS